jgi:RNA 3'-terminal phosphate cyclase (ATP)
VPERSGHRAVAAQVAQFTSTELVLQTVPMPLLFAGGPSRLALKGGTHNMLAPPFDFIAKAVLPVLRRMGASIDARLVRHGFYSRGVGRIEVDVAPGALGPIECVDIADREIACARKSLDWPDRSFAIRELPEEQGPGKILLLEAEYEHVTEVVSSFG